LLSGKTQAAGKSFAMRIDSYAGLVEGVAENDVGSFPSDPGKTR
jgi:hypothetical protein